MDTFVFPMAGSRCPEAVRRLRGRSILPICGGVPFKVGMPRSSSSVIAVTAHPVSTRATKLACSFRSQCPLIVRTSHDLVGSSCCACHAPPAFRQSAATPEGSKSCCFRFNSVGAISPLRSTLRLHNRASACMSSLSESLLESCCSSRHSSISAWTSSSAWSSESMSFVSFCSSFLSAQVAQRWARRSWSSMEDPVESDQRSGRPLVSVASRSSSRNLSMPVMPCSTMGVSLAAFSSKLARLFLVLRALAIMLALNSAALAGCSCRHTWLSLSAAARSVFSSVLAKASIAFMCLSLILRGSPCSLARCSNSLVREPCVVPQIWQ